MDWFGVFWLAIVAFFAFWQAAWGWNALKTGVATYYFRWEVARTDRPFHFWMLVASRVAGLAAAIAMLVLGFQMFRNF